MGVRHVDRPKLPAGPDRAGPLFEQSEMYSAFCRKRWTCIVFAIVSIRSLATIEKSICRERRIERHVGILLRLRGGNFEINLDEAENKRSKKKALRADKPSRTEKRHMKRERRKDRSAILAAQNLAAKEEGKLLALKRAALSRPSMAGGKNVVFEKGKGSRMTPSRQREEELGWKDHHELAERIGDGVADWRQLQAAVRRREPAVESVSQQRRKDARSDGELSASGEPAADERSHKVYRNRTGPPKD